MQQVSRQMPDLEYSGHLQRQQNKAELSTEPTSNTLFPPQQVLPIHQAHSQVASFVPLTLPSPGLPPLFSLLFYGWLRDFWSFHLRLSSGVSAHRMHWTVNIKGSQRLQEDGSSEELVGKMSSAPCTVGAELRRFSEP